MKFKPHFGDGEHALIYDRLSDGAFPSSPFRQLRRHLLGNDVIFTMALGTDVVSPPILRDNTQGFIEFLAMCQTWFDFKDDMFKRFVGRGKGLILN